MSFLVWASVNHLWMPAGPVAFTAILCCLANHAIYSCRAKAEGQGCGQRAARHSAAHLHTGGCREPRSARSCCTPGRAASGGEAAISHQNHAQQHVGQHSSLNDMQCGEEPSRHSACLIQARSCRQHAIYFAPCRKQTAAVGQRQQSMPFLVEETTSFHACWPKYDRKLMASFPWCRQGKRGRPVTSRTMLLDPCKGQGTPNCKKRPRSSKRRPVLAASISRRPSTRPQRLLRCTLCCPLQRPGLLHAIVGSPCPIAC